MKRRASARALLLGALTAVAVGAAQARSLPLCDRPSSLTATQQDRLLRFAAVAREQLHSSGQRVALVARSGLDLSRFAVRYSHAGISLLESGNTPWSVRQLYYACDAQQPRLFDQGLAGFVMGTDDPAIGFLSILLLPADAAAALEQAALDKPLALRLLAPRYSANAYPYSLRYQNCNQWVMELLASAWGGPISGVDIGDGSRAQAQAWLAAQGYAPAPVQVGSHGLMALGAFIPWVHFDDHPEADRFALQFRTSLPDAMALFVHQRLPTTRRIELCHDAHQVVVRHGWRPLAAGCVAEPGDAVVVLD